MKFTIEIKYFHPQFMIGLENIKEPWLLLDIKDPIELKTIIHRGNLYYRIPNSGKSISYRILKKSLIKKNIHVPLALDLLPF